ncbi:gastrula zinc finger protein XlCGF57.1-like isoform X2 [Macrobrachium rosenbergii]|uniref:gastrula zinc finger protein XlCGF57.1-like isoform X2 n=1 Tax=Macrobrachium rosenbergii TaxID=79674 RepID=UPI0034D75B79
MLEHDITSMEAVDNVQLHEPMQEAITEVIYHCHICMEAFVCEDIFRIHMDNHTAERPFECKICGVRFIDETHLRKHTDLKHAKGDEYEACSVCGKLFHDKINLRSHMAVHSEDRPFSCGLCGRSFKRKGELESHIIIHTGMKPHKCNLCNKAFTQKYSLKMHMRIHTGEKPFKCSICGKEFNRSSTVTLHMRQHTGEKPYNCSECGENFKLLRDLKNHLAKVHGKSGKPQFRSIPMKRGRKHGSKAKDLSKMKGKYECAICKEEFDHVSVFNDHIQTHDVDSCYLCGQELKSKGEKRRHVTRPIKLKESECFTCGVKFSKLEDFKLHMNGHTELCRLEECLRNAENLHLSSKTSQKSNQSLKPGDGDTEDEEGNLAEFSDIGEEGHADGADMPSPQKPKMRIMPEESGSPEMCSVAVKQEQFSGDEEPDTTILELVAGVEGFEVKAQSLNSSAVKSQTNSKKSISLMDSFESPCTGTTSDVDQKPKLRRQSPYKIARVSPPRTRGSLKVHFKETPKIGENKETGSVSGKNVTVTEPSSKDGEDSDDCDLAETYSIYVKNILRLQPVDKQMALIKCINTTIDKQQ